MAPALPRVGSILAIEIEVTPSSEGLPGADLMLQMLGWGQQVAIWASVAAMFGGAIFYSFSRDGGSYGGASKGKVIAVGGAIGAVLTGIAPSAVELLFEAATS